MTRIKTYVYLLLAVLASLVLPACYAKVSLPSAKVKDLSDPPAEVREKCYKESGGCYVLTQAELRSLLNEARRSERRIIRSNCR